MKVPKHGAIPESTHLNFYDQNLSVVVQENTCVIQHPEPMQKIEKHMATTIGTKDTESPVIYRYLLKIIKKRGKTVTLKLKMANML